MNKNFRYLDLITVAFVVVLILSNITSTKIVYLAPFTFDGGTILFPLSYIFGDILTEVYGYRRSRRVIWLGFSGALLSALVISLVGYLPADPTWNNQAAYDTILGLTPRLVAASLLAYFAGEFSNSFTLAKMKIWTKGRHLWARTIGSSLIGELVDTGLFVTIAFWGIYPSDLLWIIFLSNYVFKLSVEILFTPITYRLVRFLKQREGEDYYDYTTDFNPFLLK